MIIFRVFVGLQVRYFEAESYLDAAKMAVAAGIPAHLLATGKFFRMARLTDETMAAGFVADALGAA